MPFKSSEGQAVTKLTEVFRSGRETLGQAIGGGGGGGITLEKVSASGGTKSTPGDGNVYHYFTSTDTFTVTQAATDAGVFNMILVSGGGGAGSYCGGGGGGVIYGANIKFDTGNYTIAIGAGGADGNPGNPGGTTSISHPQFNVSYAGGSGGGNPSSPGANGGGAVNYGGSSITPALPRPVPSLPTSFDGLISYFGGYNGGPGSAYFGGAGAGANGDAIYFHNQARARDSYSNGGPGTLFSSIPTSFFNNGGAAGGGKGQGNPPGSTGPYGGPTTNGGGGADVGQSGGSGAALIWYPELREA